MNFIKAEILFLVFWAALLLVPIKIGALFLESEFLDTSGSENFTLIALCGGGMERVDTWWDTAAFFVVHILASFLCANLGNASLSQINTLLTCRWGCLLCFASTTALTLSESKGLADFGLTSFVDAFLANFFALCACLWNNQTHWAGIFGTLFIFEVKLFANFFEIQLVHAVIG